MAKNLTFEWLRLSILAASRPETAVRRIADLPTPLPAGVRAYLTDAANVARHRGATWAPVVASVEGLEYEPARSLTGHVCATCLQSYQGRADRGGLGQVRTVPRTFLDKNGAPDPDTKGNDGEAYGPPARVDEDKYRPVRAEDGTWKAYVNQRQNACTVCRGFDGEARVALLSGPDGLTAYREAVARAWEEHDAREVAAEAKRVERAARRGAPRLPRASAAGSKVAARLLANLDSLSEADRTAILAALAKRPEGSET